MTSSYHVELRIESRIKFLDGHYENGAGTTIAFDAQDDAALDSMDGMIERYLTDLHRREYGASFRNALKTAFVPIDTSRRAQVALEVEYAVHYYGTKFMGDGSTRGISDTRRFVKPL